MSPIEVDLRMTPNALSIGVGSRHKLKVETIPSSHCVGVVLLSAENDPALIVD